MSKDPLLNLLQVNARYTHQELADFLNLSEQEIVQKMTQLEESGAIRGYRAIVDRDLVNQHDITAFIEVKLVPVRDEGFDKLACRIARFEQVTDCYLMSGGYDLLVVVEGQDLREVAGFVSRKLSTLEGVLSTATHFRLKVYKENSLLMNNEIIQERLSVSP